MTFLTHKNPFKTIELTLVAILLPLIILSAHIIEIAGYPPCTLCLYQRIPYYLGVMIVLMIALAMGHSKILKVLKFSLVCLLLVSIGLGGYHAGVEFKWWLGPQGCSGTIEAYDVKSMVQALMNTPVASCNEPNILIFGFSLSVWNTLLSILMTGLVSASLLKK